MFYYGNYVCVVKVVYVFLQLFTHHGDCTIVPTTLERCYFIREAYLVGRKLRRQFGFYVRFTSYMSPNLVFWWIVECTRYLRKFQAYLQVYLIVIRRP
jgi:hypothetical protein